MSKKIGNPRWEIALENLKLAQIGFEKGLYSASITRCYYATYNAMWVILGGPPKGKWRHIGIAKAFAKGLRKASAEGIDPEPRDDLIEMYHLRVQADYKATPIEENECKQAISTAKLILALIPEELNPLGGKYDEPKDYT